MQDGTKYASWCVASCDCRAIDVSRSACKSLCPSAEWLLLAFGSQAPHSPAAASGTRCELGRESFVCRDSSAQLTVTRPRRPLTRRVSSCCHTCRPPGALAALRPSRVRASFWHSVNGNFNDNRPRIGHLGSVGYGHRSRRPRRQGPGRGAGCLIYR